MLAFLAPLLLKFKAVPAWAWKALGIAVAVVALFFLHQHAAHKALVQAKLEQKQADDAADAKLAQKALALKAQTDKLTAQISTLIRSNNDARINHNAGDAHALGLLGPGKAACPGNPGVPISSGGHVSIPAKLGTAGPLLPQTDSAGVPWQWLVTRAQEHDDLLAEDKAWRDWYSQVLKAWPK